MNPQQNDVIYCLAEIKGDPFYVGRSDDWRRRWKEHIWAAKRGTEAKYQHIRKLWAQGSDFELILLDENPGERYEKYYHYLLGSEFDLKNQKMGDSWRTEMAVQKIIREKGIKFSNPEEYLSAMDREIAEEKARKKAERVNARIRSNSSDIDRTLFVGEKLDKFISPALKGILRGKK